jgi:hypothetical protein
MGIGVGAVALQLAAVAHQRAATALQVDDFRLAFFFIAAICLGSVFSYLKLEPDAGAVVSGHRRVPA